MTYGVSDLMGGVSSRRVVVLRVMLAAYRVEMLLGVLAITAAGPVHSGAVVWGSAW